MDAMTIGKVAHQAGVGVETLRFYEREGLIDAPPRRVSGYRHYPPDTVRRVRFIKRAKELGFSLQEIRELLTLRLDPDATCGDVRDRARAKIADIDARIQSLERMKRTLTKLTTTCVGTGPVDACPILDALDHRDQI